MRELATTELQNRRPVRRNSPRSRGFSIFVYTSYSTRLQRLTNGLKTRVGAVPLILDRG